MDLKVELLTKLALVQEEYIKLLGDELDSIVGLARAHGWESSNVERGTELRQEMSKLKQDIIDEVVSTVNSSTEEVKLEVLVPTSSFRVHRQVLKNKNELGVDTVVETLQQLVVLPNESVIWMNLPSITEEVQFNKD
jgi:hypothetical protein